MSLPRLLNNPRFVRYGVRIDTAPEWIWLALFGVALWPAWWWLASRPLVQPFGAASLLAGAVLAALAGLGAHVWRTRQRLRAAPRLPWLAAALLLTLAASLAAMAPPAAAPLAVMALAAAAAAWLPSPAWPAPRARHGRTLFANLFLHRVLFKTVCATLLPACALATAVMVLAG